MNKSELVPTPKPFSELSFNERVIYVKGRIEYYDDRVHQACEEILHANKVSPEDNNEEVLQELHAGFREIVQMGIGGNVYSGRLAHLAEGSETSAITELKNKMTIEALVLAGVFIDEAGLKATDTEIESKIGRYLINQRKLKSYNLPR